MKRNTVAKQAVSRSGTATDALRRRLARTFARANCPVTPPASESNPPMIQPTGHTITGPRSALATHRVITTTRESAAPASPPTCIKK